MEALRCVCGYPYIMSASLGGLEWRSIHSFKYRESAAIVEWTLYQSSMRMTVRRQSLPSRTWSSQYKTNLPTLGFQSWSSSRCWQLFFIIMCVVSYLCFGEEKPSSGWNYCHFRCGKPEAEGARTSLFLPSIRQEGCMVLWPLIWGFRWCLISKVILNLVDAHLP